MTLFTEKLFVAPQVTVLDKTKMDWQEMKAADASLQEELEAHKRSDKQYLDRQVRFKGLGYQGSVLERMFFGFWAVGA